MSRFPPSVSVSYLCSTRLVSFAGLSWGLDEIYVWKPLENVKCDNSLNVYPGNQALVIASLLVLILTVYMFIVHSLEIQILHSLANCLLRNILLWTWSTLLHLLLLFYKISLRSVVSEKWKSLGTVDKCSVSSNGGFLIEQDENIFRSEPTQ